ncbi:retrovirus-related pol polyprotein from transposon TNT 1-94 [Tanacetum coccineum]
MLAPKGPTFNGRPTFANPMYLKMAQSEKPCLYEIPNDQSDPANRLVPDKEETLTLEKESRSKLNKDLVRPYDYTKLNSLYEIFKPASQEYQEQLAHTNEMLMLNCNAYMFKVKECECLAQKLSKQTETVSKEVYNELLRSFAKLEKHSISLELALQQCQEQMKNDTVYEEKASNVFLKEREQYFEIQDLKAQLQDKNIAISELKKLIEKNKGKGVDTNFEKQSILGKPPLQPIRNQSVVRQPTAKLSFAKPYDVNAPGPSRNSPKYVSFQSPKESVGSNDMIHNYYLEEAKKKAQLQKDKALNTKPSVQQSARLPNTANDPRSGLTWKPTGRIFTQVGLKWIPIRKSVEIRHNMNDSASALGNKTHNPDTTICANSSSLNADTSMASDPISSKGSSNGRNFGELADLILEGYMSCYTHGPCDVITFEIGRNAPQSLLRYTWTRFLKDKTEAFDQFEIFSKKIQNQLGCTIVSIRTDHSREFDNDVQFGEFCNANGITHNFLAPCTPQSNGMAEKRNRTLQEMSRTMLNELPVGIKRLLDDLGVTAAKNDNAPPITKVVEGIETIIAPTTAKEKAQRRLEFKARSTLLMGIYIKHQLKFNSIKDAKSFLQAVKKSFRGNATTKKTQKNLLKQQYETFTASSSKALDQTFDRHQKLITFLSLNNTSNTNGEVNTAHGATTASTQAAAINSTTIDNLSDAVIYAFFASQPNSPQLNNEDLQQINLDDLEEMDLRW